MTINEYCIKGGKAKTQTNALAARVISKNEKTVCRWRTDVVSNGGTLSESNQGRCISQTVTEEAFIELPTYFKDWQSTMRATRQDLRRRCEVGEVQSRSGTSTLSMDRALAQCGIYTLGMFRTLESIASRYLHTKIRSGIYTIQTF